MVSEQGPTNPLSRRERRAGHSQREGLNELGRWERSNQRVNEGEEFSERTLVAEVDDPGPRKERREQWPSRDTPPVVHKRDA
ncbi:hypothetical protein TNCV_1559541 [Trichonephila clavipes]|nr:hypothetical protein TNCV_1559541 [Trichonephila clavipes]